MFEFLPFLKNKSFLTRLSTLIFIIALSVVLLMVVGVLMAIPFFGTDILKNINAMDDLSDSGTIAFLKYFQVINQFGVFILPALLYGYLEERNSRNYLNIDKPPQFNLLIISIALIFVFIPAVNSLVWVNEQMKFPAIMKGIENWMRETEDKTNLLTEAFLNVNTLTGFFLNLFIIGLLAAIGEEFLFRGVILRLFNDWIKNIHGAVILSAILFSAFHLQFYGFLPRMALGIIFGYVYIWTGSLWIPIILHFVFNGTSVIVAYLYQNNLTETDSESFGVTDNTFIISASFLLSIFLLGLIYRNRKESFLQTEQLKND